jgi:MFS family permease
MANATPVAAQPASVAYSWYVVVVLLLANASSFLDRMIMGLLVDPIRASFDINDTQYSLLAGLAFALFYAGMGLPLARIADSRSRRALIAWGITVWSAMTVVCGLARGFWTLFLGRVGVGVGEATLGPAAFSMLADYFPRTMLARALSVYMMGVTLGSGLAYMIGGAVVSYVEQLDQIVLPLIGAVEGWQLTFFIVGIPGLFIAVLMITTVREPPRKGLLRQDNLRAGAVGLPLKTVVAFVWQRKTAYGSLILGVATIVMVVYALNLWGPSYLIRVFDYSRAEAGWTFGLVMIFAGTLGLLVSGTVADKWVARQPNAYALTILASVCLMLPFVVSLAFIDNHVVAIAALSGAVFFAGFHGGLAGGALQLMTPNQMRGQVMALYLLAANLLGLGLGPTVVAASTDFVFGYDAAIGKSLALAAGILCPIAALLLWSGLAPMQRQLAEANALEQADIERLAREVAA